MTIYKNNIDKDKVTIEKMITIYCKHKHDSKDELCPDCSELLHYARKRLESCKHGENKPTCGRCSIHCYKLDMRAKIKKVMRYVGPRMVLYHPIEAFRHILKALK